MDRTTRQAAAARARGLDRLRSLTIGTAVASFAGVAGFGAIAAISNSGTPATVAAANGGTDDNATTDKTTISTTTATTTTTSPLTAAPTPTPTHRRAHVSTGGSG